MDNTTDAPTLLSIEPETLEHVDGGYDYARTLQAAGQGAVAGAKIAGAFGAGWGAAAGTAAFGVGVLPSAAILGGVGAVSGGVVGGVGAAASDALDQLKGR